MLHVCLKEGEVVVLYVCVVCVYNPVRSPCMYQVFVRIAGAMFCVAWIDVLSSLSSHL